jgi:hypothetical protein
MQSIVLDTPSNVPLEDSSCWIYRCFIVAPDLSLVGKISAWTGVR